MRMKGANRKEQPLLLKGIPTFQQHFLSLLLSCLTPLPDRISTRNARLSTARRDEIAQVFKYASKSDSSPMLSYRHLCAQVNSVQVRALSGERATARTVGARRADGVGPWDARRARRSPCRYQLPTAPFIASSQLCRLPCDPS